MFLHWSGSLSASRSSKTGSTPGMKYRIGRQVHFWRNYHILNLKAPNIYLTHIVRKEQYQTHPSSIPPTFPPSPRLFIGQRTRTSSRSSRSLRSEAYLLCYGGSGGGGTMFVQPNANSKFTCSTVQKTPRPSPPLLSPTDKLG